VQRDEKGTNSNGLDWNKFLKSENYELNYMPRFLVDINVFYKKKAAS